MEVDNAGRGATSASSSTARAPMDVDSATAKGPSTTAGAMTIPRELANDILAAFFFPRSCLVVHATWSVITSEKNKN